MSIDYNALKVNREYFRKYTIFKKININSKIISTRGEESYEKINKIIFSNFIGSRNHS